jgi:hypothetical protein
VFNLTGIFVPVELTLFIGEPILIDWDSTSDGQAADQVISELQALIDQHQPYGHNYLPGLQDRLQHFLEFELPGGIAKILSSIGDYFQKNRKRE